MKVKIGNKIYNSENQPIMLILSQADKNNIANMDPKATKYCSFPESVGSEEIIKFMTIKEH